MIRRRLAYISGVLLVVALGAVFALGLRSESAVADVDCSAFPNQAAAQEYFIAAGGPAYDPNNLDGDNDGIACEALPCPCSTGAAPPPAEPAPEPVIVNHPPPQPRPAFWKNFGAPAEPEPQEIAIEERAGYPFYVVQVRHWRDWGDGYTIGSGKLTVPTCRPSCANTNYKTYGRARVELSKIRGECGQRRYMNVRVILFHGPARSLGPWANNCRGVQTFPR